MSHFDTQMVIYYDDTKNCLRLQLHPAGREFGVVGRHVVIQTHFMGGYERLSIVCDLLQAFNCLLKIYSYEVGDMLLYIKMMYARDVNNAYIVSEQSVEELIDVIFTNCRSFYDIFSVILDDLKGV